MGERVFSWFLGVMQKDSPEISEWKVQEAKVHNMGGNSLVSDD